MELIKMHEAIPFSPTAKLSQNIGKADTIIPVDNVSAFPAGPGLATIGIDEEAETIRYATITDNALSGCERGIEGTAKAWPAGENIARNFTAKDWNDIKENVEGLHTEVTGLKESLDTSIENANTAAKNANTAAESANDAAGEANTAADNANTATNNADSAADAANKVANELQKAKENGVFNGATGKTAYQYATENGYTGTEVEFGIKLGKDIPSVAQGAGQSEALVMSQKAVTDLVAEALEQIESTEYETVDSVDEMTDTTKQYVLSTDGFIYTYTTKTETVQHEPENKFVPSEATLNKRMGSSSLSAQDGYVWTGAIPIDLTEDSPFEIKVEGTQITEPRDINAAYQKIWLCADNTGTTKLSAAILMVGQSESSNYGTLLEDGTIYADYKAGAKLSDSIISGTKYVRIGFKFSDSAISSADELSGVSIKFLHEAYEEVVDASEWVSTGKTPEELSGNENYVDLLVKINQNTSDIIEVSNRVTAIEAGSDTVTVPTFWQDAVDICISKIKALQVGRHCVTVAHFADNHQNLKHLGVIIQRVMQECHIPYCFFNGDAITNAAITNDANMSAEEKMIAQDKAFDDEMSVVSETKMCRSVGNHDGYWLDEAGIKNRYNRSQIYDLFLRQESIVQNKHYGGDGTYYYCDDLSSETRFVVCNTNYNINTATETLDSEQLGWLNDVIFNDANKNMNLVFFSHQPITNNHHSNIYAETAHAIQDLLTAKINAGWNVVGWFSGHIHADRIYQTDHTNDTEANDQSTVTLPWKTVTIRADHTGLCRDTELIHTVANDDKSHAIDFVTINKKTRTVNITRLGIGEDRSYTY